MIPMIGIASGVGAPNPGCGEAPIFLQKHPNLLKNIDYEWVEIFAAPTHPEDRYQKLSNLYQKVAKKTFETFKKHKYLVSIGGDHSCAIGTWSGIAEAVKPLGLLWIDAHMDSHTPETTESGQIHGMGVAALLGYGDSRLTNILSPKPKILPEHIALVGVRSFEEGEAKLLKRLGVRVYFIEEVKKRGLREVMKEALGIVSQNTAGYGISFDLDAFDPRFAMGVGTPVENGLDPDELFESFSCFNELPPIAFEVVEYNPNLDINFATAKLMIKLLETAAKLRQG